MGCANCPKNVVNQGLVMISEPSSPDEMDKVEKNKRSKLFH